jgi:hypothetical protein
MPQIVSTGRTISTTEFLEKRQKARRKRWLIYSIVLLALLIGLVLVSRLDNLRINEVSVVGASVIPKDDVVRVARDVMSEKYLWLVPKDNSLVYPEEAVREMLFRKFPRFNSVGLSVSGLQSLEISVTEREPSALYCLKDTTPCYFMDESGFIFDYAPTFSEGVYLIYSEVSPSAEPLGTQFLPVEEFHLLARFVSSLSILGLEPLSIEKGEADFSLALKSGARLRWSRGHDINRVSSNLESFLHSPAIKGQADFLERVVELDLRTEDKVFYRFQE